MTKKDKLNRLAKAANNIRAAKEALQQIIEADDWYIQDDAKHFHHELEYFLNGDDGDGGLDALIAIVKKDVTHE